MSQFAIETLRAALDSVKPQFRCVFAALCAERLQPWFSLISKIEDFPDPRCVPQSLDVVWEYALSNGDMVKDVSLFLARCKSEAERSSRHEAIDISNGCVSCSAYALMALRSGEAKDASWAGQVLSDVTFNVALTRKLADRTGIVFVTKEDRVEAESNPLVKRALQLQNDDVIALQTLPTVGYRQRLESLRQQAADVRNSLFPDIDPRMG